MSAYHGRGLGLPDLLSFDMGGTTAKGALIRRYAPLKQYDLEVGRVHEFKRGSGLPAKLPVIDMIEIGAGGGSLARVDERGLIRVGPRSGGRGPRSRLLREGRNRGHPDGREHGARLPRSRVLSRRRDASRCGRRARRDRTARGGAGGARSDPGRVGRARDRERGRGACVPDPRLGTGIRLSELVHGRVRRVRSGARARDRSEASDSAGRVSDRGGRDVGPGTAGQPARLRSLAVAAGVRGRSRRAGIRTNHRPPRRRGVRFPAPGRHSGPGHRLPAGHALPGAGLRDRGNPPRRTVRRRQRRSPSHAWTICSEPSTPRSSRRRFSTSRSRSSAGRWKRQARRQRSPTAASGGVRAGGQSGPARSGSAMLSSNARFSTATHSRPVRRSGARPSSRSANPPACSDRGTGAAVDERLNLVADLASGGDE